MPLLNARPVRLRRLLPCFARSYQPGHDAMQKKFQSLERRSQIIGIRAGLAIQAVLAS
jgi:hypothetical protein